MRRTRQSPAEASLENGQVARQPVRHAIRDCFAGEPLEPEQRRPEHRRRLQPHNPGGRRGIRDGRGQSLVERGILGTKHAAREDHVGVQAAQPQTAGSTPRP